jgi:hypothetical protein
MSSYIETLKQIRAAREARDKEKDVLYDLQLRHLSEKNEQSRAKVNQQIGVVKGRTDNIHKHINDLFIQRTPQELIEEWNDKIPVALFPVRLETKFKLNETKKELWVRVFPDDIAVVTHEKVLTKTEVEYGTAYWKAVWKAKDNEDEKKTAWKMIADKFDGNRAAWVAQERKPLNWSNADILVDENDLQFPLAEITKPDSWTAAPHTRILPDRFVLMGYQNGVLKHMQVGKPVNDIVILGPAPMEDADNPSITRNKADNRLQYGEEFKWMVDFELAVQQGLGFVVPLDAATAVAGFERLLVVGIKLSADENDGKLLVEDLLNNHHYSSDGLGIIRQGTPTNNTDEKDAGYASQDPLQTISYYVEAGKPLFTPVNAKENATDGQRLAEYLGIDYAPLQYIVNSGAKDNVEAVAMNKALFSGTLGYYLNSMLNEVVPDESIEKLRVHFTNYVTGRGPISAIRIGSQPYGILPVSAFSKWKYPEDLDWDVASMFRRSFRSMLYYFLTYLQGQWKAKLPQLAHISKQGDASENLMEVLGLQPSSVEYFQRIGYSFDYLNNMGFFNSGNTYVQDAFKMLNQQGKVTDLFKQFGYTTTREDQTAKPMPLLLQLILMHGHTPLDVKNLIDGEPFSEELTIKPYDKEHGYNYIHWMLNNLSSKKLQQQDFGNMPKPHYLLYMLLRYSLLHETSHSIYHYLKKKDITAVELIRSRKFANITSTPTVSHWEIFDAPVNKIVGTEVSSIPLFEYMHSPQFNISANLDVVQYLNEHVWALNILKDMPTARLERTLAEHLDLLSFRLDAWQTSLFDDRLREQRKLNAAADSRQQGLYIGAYGYLENVKPGYVKRTKVSEDTLPLPLREKKDNLFIEQNNGGYVHAPSLNHATAAAILRNGYLTHAKPAERELLTVNLSSERVRRAQYLIEGIRNGQTLEVLLGYQFERGLHDWSTRPQNPVILNQLLPVFRKAFPVKKTKVPQEGKINGPEETTDDFHVVNGLALATLKTAFPYGIADMPALTAVQKDAIQQEKANIENTLDAMRDLLVSESAYQLALGNFERATAVMQSVSGAQLPPDIEVINSARGTDLSFTNRVVIHFDVALTTNPWPVIEMTRRALTEPAMNHWLGQLLGDPAKIKCIVQAVDQEGNILKKADNSAIAGPVSLLELGIQPLDFIYLIRNKLEESGTSELETRIRYVFAQQQQLSDDTIVKILFADSDAGGDPTIKSFAEILPFANYIRELVSGAKVLGARDFAIASKAVVAVGDNPQQVNIPELKVRVQQVLIDFTALFGQLNTAINDANTLKTPAAITVLRSKLVAIANAGYVFAFPQSAIGFAPEQLAVLVSQGKSLQQRFAGVIAQYNSQLAIVEDVNTKPPQQVSLLTEMLQLMLGADFVLMPRFSFADVADVAQAFANKKQIVDYATNTLQIPLLTDEWLHGVSQVRPKMQTFEMVRLLNDTYNITLIDLAPIQLPYKDKDAWLAVEFPKDTTIDHDTLSIVQYVPQGFNASKEQIGLLLDEWTESIPNKEEVTGISFNYNQPNSVPPQAILLAVTPVETGHWTWNDLTDSILETFSRAKERAIEPDHIDQMNIPSTLLPAILSEFSTSRTNLSLDFSLNIAAVLSSVMALDLNKS